MKSKVLTALLCVVIAFGLWVYVITVERTEIESTFYNVPVVLDGESVLQERGLMITSDTDLTVNLKLAGNRSDLNKLKSSDITVLVDLTRIYEAGEKSLGYDVAVPGNNAVEVVSRSPDSIKLTVAEWASKQVNVVLSYAGRVPDGYTVDKQNATTDVNSVMVSGPKDIINQIAMAKVTVDLNGKTQTVVDSLRYALCDESGNPIDDVSSVTTNQGQIRVTVPIQKIKELKLEYTVIDGGFLTKDNVSIKLNYDSITVAGSAATLDAMGDSLYIGTIDLGTIKESTSIIFPVVLPEGVVNQSGITEVTADVTLPPVETKIIKVPSANFQATNLPVGLKVEKYTTVSLDVEIRGRNPVLDSITADDIIVLVDFSDAVAGDSTSFAARIRIVGYENAVGAVGTYSVFATVTEA